MGIFGRRRDSVRSLNKHLWSTMVGVTLILHFLSALRIWRIAARHFSGFWKKAFVRANG